VRSIPAAVAIVLVTPLLIEPVIAAPSGLSALSWLPEVVPYLPFTAGMRLVGAGLAGASEGQSVLDPFTRWEGGLVFAGFTVLLLALPGSSSSIAMPEPSTRPRHPAEPQTNRPHSTPL